MQRQPAQEPKDTEVEMNRLRKQGEIAPGIDVVVFDGAEFFSARRCRGVAEARSFMRRIGDLDGFDCLIVSPRLLETLLSVASRVA